MKNIGLFLAAVLIGISSARSQSSTSVSYSYIWPDSLIGQSINVNSLWVDGDSNDILAATADMGIMQTTDDGAVWTQLPINLDWWSRYSYAVVRDPKTNAILVGTVNGLFRSTDNGSSWTQPSPPSPYTTWKHSASITCFLIRGDAIMAGISGGILQSFDGGENWKTIFYDSTLYVNTLVYTRGFIFAGTVNIANSASVFCSTNEGKTWQPSDNGINFQDVEAIAADSNGVLYAGTGNPFTGTGDGVYQSIDNGGTWTKITGIDSSQKEATTILVGQKNTIFVGFSGQGSATGGVFKYDGARWTQVVPNSINGIPIGVMSLAIQNHSLLVGTTNGLWRVDGVITAVHATTNQPYGFTLNQNYPNPFNPTTTISYTVALRTFVTLKVYNVLGQEVATLVDGTVSPGIRVVQFDGSHFPSGTYFYCLTTSDGLSLTKKMLLLK